MKIQAILLSSLISSMAYCDVYKTVVTNNNETNPIKVTFLKKEQLTLSPTAQAMIEQYGGKMSRDAIETIYSSTPTTIQIAPGKTSTLSHDQSESYVMVTEIEKNKDKAKKLIRKKKKAQPALTIVSVESSGAMFSVSNGEPECSSGNCHISLNNFIGG